MNIKSLIKNPKAYIKAVNKKCIQLLRANTFKGEKVYCENCSWKGKKFFDDECPRCKSLPRTRLIPFSIEYFELSKPNLKVLHVAPNKTEYIGVKAKIDKVYQYDRLDIRANKDVNLVEDLTQLTLQDETYDLVIIWHVFEHIAEDTKAISEVYRVLKSKGHLLMSVPIFPVNNQTTYEDKSIPYKNYESIHGHIDHCRSCGLDYYMRFEDVGFKTQELQVKKMLKKQIIKYGLSTKHVVWCFIK